MSSSMASIRGGDSTKMVRFCPATSVGNGPRYGSGVAVIVLMNRSTLCFVVGPATVERCPSASYQPTRLAQPQRPSGTSARPGEQEQPPSPPRMGRGEKEGRHLV